MASAEVAEINEEQLVNAVADAEASLAVRRYFTIPGRDPFDEIEWETRDALIPGKDKPVFEQRGGEFASEEEADTFEAELKALLVNQYVAFNSPVWFNVGFEEKPQCSACFILSIEDSMEAILDWIRREGIIFRGGSGSGVNLSKLRSSKEQLSKGGYASGPVSFMRGADASAGTIKSGGKTRRAAKMVVLDVDHP